MDESRSRVNLHNILQDNRGHVLHKIKLRKMKIFPVCTFRISTLSLVKLAKLKNSEETFPSRDTCPAGTHRGELEQNLIIS